MARTSARILTNVVDLLQLPSEWHLGSRLVAFAVTILPSLVIIIGRFFGFVELVKAAGALGGVLIALLPVLVVRRARKLGPREPEYAVPRWLGWPAQAAMAAFYLGTLAYAAFAL